MTIDFGTYSQPKDSNSDSVVPFVFNGKADEYFRIWIVNIFLSILTLGIYSAWAKVRRNRYFYGNTTLNGSSFQYLADPMDILRGRIIVFFAFCCASAFSEVGEGLIVFVLYFLLLPYFVVVANTFNALNSAYRNIRFNFGFNFPPQTGFARHLVPGYLKTAKFLVLPVLLIPLSLGLMYPYFVFRKRQFILEHTAFGSTYVSFDADVTDYYRAYLYIFLLFVLFLIGSVLTLGIAALPLYSWYSAYRDARIGKLSWAGTNLGRLQFHCNWKAWDLFKLYLVNSFATIVTLGLAIPWTAIRTSRYQLQGLSLQPANAIDEFIAAESDHAGAIGDEASDLLGIDISI